MKRKWREKQERNWKPVRKKRCTCLLLSCCLTTCGKILFCWFRDHGEMMLPFFQIFFFRLRPSIGVRFFRPSLFWSFVLKNNLEILKVFVQNCIKFASGIVGYFVLASPKFCFFLFGSNNFHLLSCVRKPLFPLSKTIWPFPPFPRRGSRRGSYDYLFWCWLQWAFSLFFGGFGEIKQTLFFNGFRSEVRASAVTNGRDSRGSYVEKNSQKMM